MILFKLLIILLALVIVPFCMGWLLSDENDGAGVICLYGLIIEWAVFFVVSVPMILKGYLLSNVTLIVNISFAVVSVTALVHECLTIKRQGIRVNLFTKNSFGTNDIILLAIMLVLIAFIVYKAIFFVYADGDDAFYISIAQSANVSDYMYRCDPYKGDALFLSNIPMRYALAPMPMWIAWLARISGINVAIVSHVILAPLLIVLAFCIYYEIAKYLFEKNENRLLFMIAILVWHMFSNVSTNTVETFLITRSRQGKAALGSIIIPFAILLFLKLSKAGFKVTRKFCVSLMILGLAAAITSLLGNLLILVFYSLMLIAILIKNRRIKNIIGILIGCAPNVLVFVGYLFIN